LKEKQKKKNEKCLRFGFHFHVISVAIREVLSAVPISYADFSQSETKAGKKLEFSPGSLFGFSALAVTIS